MIDDIDSLPRPDPHASARAETDATEPNTRIGVEAGARMSARSSLCVRLAALFRSRPGQWMDGRDLAAVAGAYGWRTRVSDLRRQPYAMKIENRLRRVTRRDGSSYVVSEYRHVPGETT